MLAKFLIKTDDKLHVLGSFLSS